MLNKNCEDERHLWSPSSWCNHLPLYQHFSSVGALISLSEALLISIQSVRAQLEPSEVVSSRDLSMSSNDIVFERYPFFETLPSTYCEALLPHLQLHHRIDVIVLLLRYDIRRGVFLLGCLSALGCRRLRRISLLRVTFGECLQEGRCLHGSQMSRFEWRYWSGQGY